MTPYSFNKVERLLSYILDVFNSDDDSAMLILIHQADAVCLLGCK